MMKNIIKCFLISLVFYFFCKKNNICFAQSPDWMWAKSSGSKSYDFSNGICADLKGNIYVIGSFDSPSLSFGKYTITNAGLNDIFITKYNSAGNVLWVRTAGGTDHDIGNGACVDKNGNVYITGYFESPTLEFDSITLINKGKRDIFIAKYSSSGKVLWAKGIGGADWENEYSICADKNGNLYATGYFESPSITFDTTTLKNLGNLDIFIIKYDSSGKVLWAKSAGGKDIEHSYGICVDKNGNSYITGKFTGSSINFGTTTLINAGNSDIFIAKYDLSGNVLWAKSAGGTDDDYSGIGGICVDNSGNSYVTGTFLSSKIIFDSTTLINEGGNDVFLVKYNSSGKVIWAQNGGGEGDDWGSDITLDKNGNIYIIGMYNSPVITFGMTMLANVKFYDIFIVKFNSSGRVLWAKSVGGNKNDTGDGITVDNNGYIYISGSFCSPSVSFGKTVLYNFSDGFSDIFVAKLSNK